MVCYRVVFIIMLIHFRQKMLKTNDGRYEEMQRKTRYFALLFVLFVLAFAGVNQTNYVQAKETSKKIEKICLYLGQKITLADLPEGEVILSKEHVIEVSPDKVVTAVGAGTVTISVKTETETLDYAEIEVKKNEILSTLTFNRQSFAAHLLGGGSFQLSIPQFGSMTSVWQSKTPAVASVTQEGIITPVSAGWAEFAVTVTDSYGGVYSFVLWVQILQPKFTIQKQNLAKGCRTTLLLESAAGNPVVYQTRDTSIVSIVSYNQFGVVVKAKKVGSTTVVAQVDGVQTECVITVTNPKVKKAYGFYQKKKKLTVKVTGLNAASRPVFRSSDVKVAVVTASGKVTTKKYGSAVISCEVDGKTVNYYLAVSTKTAVRAMRYGYKQIGKKKYSQARRMDKNYYDCSSFVYRTYRAVGRYLVCKTSWAPVAADIGHYYARKGKRIKAKKTYSEKKMRPGDLVCFGGSKAKKNRRYKRIYHIAIYIGNGKTMESSSTYNNVVIRDRGTFKKSEIPVVVRP